jgi:hypothetical protein
MAGCFVPLTGEENSCHFFHEYLYAVVLGTTPVFENAHIDTTFY